MSETPIPAVAQDEGPVDVHDIMKKFDKESDYREFTGFFGKIVAAIAIVFSLFQVYTAMFGVFDAMIQRSVHVAFAMCLTFLLFPSRSGPGRS